MKHTTTQLDFAAKPRVTAVKPKYREERLDGTNLMNDPRVVRGNTYAAIVQNKNDIQPPPRKQPQPKPQKKGRMINFDTGFEMATPRAIDGRQHFTVQTQPFVETLRDRPIQYEKQCQTDLYLDRPVERQFDPMKGKTGSDRFTQIEENDPELFNFDYEVEPIVEALFSKIVQTSRMELYQEKQLREKQKEKDQYQRRRHAKLAEAQKLEANEVRLKEEYDRRQLQHRKANQQQSATQKKVIGRILSKQYLSNLRKNTQSMLEFQGFFRQPLETDLFSVFAPWLYQEILQELHRGQNYAAVGQRIIEEAEKDLAAESQKYVKAERDRRNNIIRERQEAIRRKQALKEQKQRQKQQAERAALQGDKQAEQPEQAEPTQ